MIGRPLLDFASADQGPRDWECFTEALQSGIDITGYVSRVHANAGGISIPEAKGSRRRAVP